MYLYIYMTHVCTYVCMYILVYIYIYIYVCVCAKAGMLSGDAEEWKTLESWHAWVIPGSGVSAARSGGARSISKPQAGEAGTKHPSTASWWFSRFAKIQLLSEKSRCIVVNTLQLLWGKPGLASPAHYKEIWSHYSETHLYPSAATSRSTRDCSILRNRIASTIYKYHSPRTIESWALNWPHVVPPHVPTDLVLCRFGLATIMEQRPCHEVRLVSHDHRELAIAGPTDPLVSDLHPFKASPKQR